MLKRVEADLENYAVCEQFPKMEGRQMVMVLAPLKKVKSKPEAKVSKMHEKDQEEKKVIESDKA